VKKNQSALLAKYFSMYKKNPRSKVFAPLAESFRKLGMLDDAFKVLRDGIRYHPTYPLGYIVLAHCQFDQGKYDLAYNTLRPIIAQNADNISLQKIFAQTCINLGHLEEALDTYKYLLFMNPQDKFFAAQVKQLEDDMLVGHKKLSIEQIISSPEPLNVPSSMSQSEDDWVQVSFGQSATTTPTSIPDKPVSDEWVMNKPGSKVHPILQTEEIKKPDLEDDYYADEFEEDYGEIDDVNAQNIASDAPIVSHTLIDLYCAQQYYDKAIELLEKILELNPDDRSSLLKLDQVRQLRTNSGEIEDPAVTEQDQHDELIKIIETQVKTKSPKELLIEKKFTNFLDALKERALEQR
jgi:tetratricopeptide (TPR) repeat protein